MTSLRALGEPLCASGLDWRAAINAVAYGDGIKTKEGRQISFVDQSELPAHSSYEAFIHASGTVPTRENLHDFFNAMMWLRYPRIKVRLNALQAAGLIAEQGVGKKDVASMPMHRSRLRDALTLFDENTAIVAISDPSLSALLRSHAWAALFIDRRSALSTCYEVFPFGHALIEKLVTPYKAITAHAWLVPVAPDFFAQPLGDKVAYLDATVALQLDEKLQPAAFSPLPVLGLPNWWPAQDDDFYADQQVFRQRRYSANN